MTFLTSFSNYLVTIYQSQIISQLFSKFVLEVSLYYLCIYVVMALEVMNFLKFIVRFFARLLNDFIAWLFECLDVA